MTAVTATAVTEVDAAPPSRLTAVIEEAIGPEQHEAAAHAAAVDAVALTVGDHDLLTEVLGDRRRRGGGRCGGDEYGNEDGGGKRSHVLDVPDPGASLTSYERDAAQYRVHDPQVSFPSKKATTATIT
jgi:hypothetical protein